MSNISRLGALGAILLVCQALQADTPARFFTEFPATGGDGVTGGGDWSLITDTGTCEVRAYELDYSTMGWVLSEILEVPGGFFADLFFCGGSEFGASSSSGGDVLVVGAPALRSSGTFLGCEGVAPNDRGGFFVYEREGGAWVQKPVGNACGGILESPAGSVAGDRVGESVSLSRVPGTDFYFIAIGSPGRGAGDAGRVWFYVYNAASDSLVQAGTPFQDGLAAGDRLGESVTVSAFGSNGVVLGGAPGALGGLGAVDVFRVTGPVTPVDTLSSPAAPPGNALGQSLSLSDDLAVGAGVTEAFLWENTGSPGNPAYDGDDPSLTVLTGGGDVSQTGGQVAFGESFLFDGAVIARMPLEDNLGIDSVNVDTSQPVGGASLGGDLSDVAADIRFTRESLWFANPAEDRAFVYRFPAGLGARIDTAFQYQQRSIPCDAAGRSVDDLFGYLGDSVGSGGSDFDIFLYDPTNVTSGRPFVRLDDGYTFTTENLRYSLWIAVATPGYVSIADCNGFTSPDFVPAVDGGTPFVDAIRTQKAIELPSAETPAGGGPDFARVMVNNPYPRTVRLADLRYRDPAGVEKTLAEADAADEVFGTAYVYDPGNASSTAQGYRPVTLAGTPPFGDRVQGHEGFWLQVEENGKDPAAPGGDAPLVHALFMPQPE